MTWHTTTTEKPANSVDVLGWTGEKYVVASFSGTSWLAADRLDGYQYWDADYIKSWMPLPTAPASAPVSPQTPARE
jgi:hypothetical protein